MKRHYYSNTIAQFLNDSSNEILGVLSQNNEFDLEQTQRYAWTYEIEILKRILNGYNGSIFFEYAIPRMGRRIDVVLIINAVIFVLEFKVGEKEYLLSSIDQVWDYALDLKNFHETSHDHLIAPILIATEAKSTIYSVISTSHNDNLLFPIKTNTDLLKEVIDNVLLFSDGKNIIIDDWVKGRYSPTPTIIEAAMALYNSHSVAEISRSDASAINLTETSNSISRIIEEAERNQNKAICFVTGYLVQEKLWWD